MSFSGQSISPLARLNLLVGPLHCHRVVLAIEPLHSRTKDKLSSDGYLPSSGLRIFAIAPPAIAWAVQYMLPPTIRRPKQLGEEPHPSPFDHAAESLRESGQAIGWCSDLNGSGRFGTQRELGCVDAKVHRETARQRACTDLKLYDADRTAAWVDTPERLLAIILVSLVDEAPRQLFSDSQLKDTASLCHRLVGLQ